jgi:hypothetical protein
MQAGNIALAVGRGGGSVPRTVSAHGAPAPANSMAPHGCARLRDALVSPMVFGMGKTTWRRAAISRSWTAGAPADTMAADGGT